MWEENAEKVEGEKGGKKSKGQAKIFSGDCPHSSLKPESACKKANLFQSIAFLLDY